MQGGDSTAVISAGLPNINGNFYVAGYSDAAALTTPPFSVTGQNLTDSHEYSGQTVGGTNINMSLSRSNAIYGASTTVQPPAISLIPQIRY